MNSGLNLQPRSPVYWSEVGSLAKAICALTCSQREMRMSLGRTVVLPEAMHLGSIANESEKAHRDWQPSRRLKRVQITVCGREKLQLAIAKRGLRLKKV